MVIGTRGGAQGIISNNLFWETKIFVGKELWMAMRKGVASWFRMVGVFVAWLGVCISVWVEVAIFFGRGRWL